MIGGVPVPARMSHLKLDPRGYPIPVMVVIDDGGRPHFQINDEMTRQRIIAEDRCAICGSKLFRGRWFVGGPMSAFSERGSYIDPPLHRECAEYALMVCPYLAVPHYGRELGTKTLKGRPLSGTAISADPTMIAGRPPYFVAVMAVGTEHILHSDAANAVDEVGALVPQDFVRFLRFKTGSVRELQVWQHGHRITSSAELAVFFRQVAMTLVTEYGEQGRADVWEFAVF
jgi:hypothetical protein